jgi:hypothetical protein
VVVDSVCAGSSCCFGTAANETHGRSRAQVFKAVPTIKRKPHTLLDVGLSYNARMIPDVAYTDPEVA